MLNKIDDLIDNIVGKGDEWYSSGWVLIGFVLFCLLMLWIIF